MNLIPTASQTVGPYVHLGLNCLTIDRLAVGSAGELVTIAGRVLDGNRQPVVDAFLETWQADRNGQYASLDAVRASERS